MKQSGGFDKKADKSLAGVPERAGFYAAVLTTVITIVTFGFAMTAIPNSGANCREGCIDYPYLDTLAEFPRDYRWMVGGILLLLSYVVLVTAIHYLAADEWKVFSHAGLLFASISAAVLSATYFVQFSVVPVSLMNGETEGIPLLTQYNPHGTFIALEEVSYLVMSLSFLFLAPVFAQKSPLETAIRWIFVTAFVLAIGSFIWILLRYGIERLDRFEVVVISIDWLVLIANGILLTILFRNRLLRTTQLLSC